VKDYYAVMGLSREATVAEIRSRWKILARQYHPDRNPDDPLAETAFKEVQEAYRVLSDASKREHYDLGRHLQHTTDQSIVHHYFYVRCEPKVIRCFDEFQLIFTYSGSGRIFRKPNLDKFFVTGSPYISQRSVIHEGVSVKETSLTYVVCPLQTGQIDIGAAAITINHTLYNTEPVSVSSTPNYCRFSKGGAANGKPFRLTMHYEYLPGEEPLIISELKKNHTILVPRSKTAHMFHSIGSGMKVVFTIWVMIKLSQWFGLNIFAGMLAGNLFAGLNCHLMYRLAGIKSKYEAAAFYKPVKDYGERGYYLGESTGIPLISGNFWYFFGRLFL
jgi:hypothetical protein